MPHPLDGCPTKLARADELRDDLRDDVARWYAAGNGQLVGEYRPEPQEYAYVATIDDPPLRWGAILGDWAHNLRSSLDLLTWQLVLRAGAAPTHRTQFPIFVDESRYAARAPRMIAGVTQGVSRTIQELQPYHPSPFRIQIGRSDNMPRHPLAQLAWISNTDKHRLLHPTMTALAVRIEGPGPRGPLTGIPNHDAGRILGQSWHLGSQTPGGGDVVRFRLEPRGPRPTVRLTHNLYVGVGFAFGDWMLAIDNLQDIRAGVGEVFERLAPEFDIP
jgi:hypothetical protein